MDLIGVFIVYFLLSHPTEAFAYHMFISLRRHEQPSRAPHHVPYQETPGGYLPISPCHIYVAVTGPGGVSFHQAQQSNALVSHTRGPGSCLCKHFLPTQTEVPQAGGVAVPFSDTQKSH